ncbi:hypothetical protein FJ938_04705 [Mesorhizobium sp. B2-4-14]|nr:hypothetical protein FJ938_04705 [Mesorhizobium sp. B2-4-14]
MAKSRKQQIGLVSLGDWPQATRPFVILARSKERSDAAQTLGSMPGHQLENVAVQAAGAR